MGNRSGRWSSRSLEAALKATGRAVEADDGMLHIEAETGTTLCGKAVEAYPLHWDVRTVIACGSCLVAAGVPVGKAAS